MSNLQQNYTDSRSCPFFCFFFFVNFDRTRMARTSSSLHSSIRLALQILLASIMLQDGQVRHKAPKRKEKQNFVMILFLMSFFFRNRCFVRMGTKHDVLPRRLSIGSLVDGTRQCHCLLAAASSSSSHHSSDSRTCFQPIFFFLIFVVGYTCGSFGGGDCGDRYSRSPGCGESITIRAKFLSYS